MKTNFDSSKTFPFSKAADAINVFVNVGPFYFDWDLSLYGSQLWVYFRLNEIVSNYDGCKADNATMGCVDIDGYGIYATHL